MYTFVRSSKYGTGILPFRNFQPSRHKTVILIAFIAGLISLLRDVLLLHVFSFGELGDSESYMRLGTDLRSVPYPLINTLLGASANAITTVWFQIIVAALAVGVLVYVIGKHYPKLAAGIGLLCALDFTWSAGTRWILTESLFTSFHVLTLACLIHQYDRNKRLRWWELLSAGALYGWTMTIRPSGVFLILPIAIAYLWFTHSPRKVGWLLAGVSIILLASGFINLQYTGKFRLFSGTGYYVAFPLYTYHLFSVDNGPVSQHLDELIRTCEPNIDYQKINFSTHNDYLWGKLFPCLQNKHGLPLDQISDLFTSAYSEAIRKQPVRFIQELIAQHSTFISYPVGRTIEFWPLNVKAYSTCRGENWCIEARNRACSQPDLCVTVANSVQALADTLAYSTQIHITFLPFLPGTEFPPLQTDYWQWPEYWISRPYISGLVAWGVIACILIFMSRGVAKFIALACLVFVHYTMFTVVAGHVITSRYIQVLSPFYIILTAITVATVIQLLFDPTASRWKVVAVRITVALLIVGMVGQALMSIVISHVTSHWLVSHVAAYSRLVVEDQARELIELHDASPVAQSWDWKTTAEMTPRSVSRWLTNGAHYLVISDKTPNSKNFTERLQELEQQGATILYRSNRILGFGHEQAVLWSFRPQHTLNVTFDNSLLLIGYNVIDKSGSRPSLLFHWYTQTIPKVDYHIFVHLVDTDGTLIAQADTQVGGGIHPTTTWRQNELVFETVELPLDMLQRAKHVTIGLYQFDSGRHAVIQNAAHEHIGDDIGLTIP